MNKLKLKVKAERVFKKKRMWKIGNHENPPSVKIPKIAGFVDVVDVMNVTLWGGVEWPFLRFPQASLLSPILYY